jgi:hypothetical protein
MDSSSISSVVYYYGIGFQFPLFSIRMYCVDLSIRMYCVDLSIEDKTKGASLGFDPKNYKFESCILSIFM